MPKPNSLIAITHGRALINRRWISDAVVLIGDGKIVAAGAAKQVHIPRGAQRVDASDRLVVPGFIDIHIHGAGGFRAEDGAPGMARHVIRNGTTWFLPTIMANEFDNMLVSIDHVGGGVGPVRGGATIGGIHLEGPFLNPKYGAQRPETCVKPTPRLVRQLIERCGEGLRLVTIAPERPGAVAAIQAFRDAGATVSIGHSDATEEEYLAGRAAGITHATHLFNAMPPRVWPTKKTYLGTKVVGVEELVLGDSEVSADILCDMTAAHVHPSMVKIACNCKGVEKLSLITDAMPSAGLPYGEFKMADGQSVFTKPTEDVARLANGGLCGSVLNMCGAVRNIVNHTSLPLEDALTMVSEAPARAVGVFGRKGSLARGKDADLVLLDSDLNVRTVMIGGRVEFNSQGGGQ